MISVSKRDFDRQIVPDDCPDTSYLEQEGFADRLEQYRQGALITSGSARPSNCPFPTARIES